MGLTVITFTRNERPNELKRCIVSVEKNLPTDAKYKVYECLDNFTFRRFEQTLVDDYVAFVDDDDEVVNNSINVAYNAHKLNDVGLVFTDELRLINDTNPVHDIRGVRKYDDLLKNPRTAHHLSMVNTKYIDVNAVYSLMKKYGTYTEWITKTSAAMSHNALHIPIIGYKWYTNTRRATRTMDKSNNYNCMHLLGADMRNTFTVRDAGEKIPQFTGAG